VDAQCDQVDRGRSNEVDNTSDGRRPVYDTDTFTQSRRAGTDTGGDKRENEASNCLCRGRRC